MRRQGRAPGGGRRDDRGARPRVRAAGSRRTRRGQQAERIRADLFKAQTSLLLDGGAGATRSVDQARSALAGELERGLRSRSPRELRIIDAQLAAAREAAASGDEVALAAARGRILAALRRGAYAVTLSATRDGAVAEARAWLLIRDFRQATRFTRPGVDATAALQALEAGRIDADQAASAVKKDLLDAYQARLLTYLDEAEQARQRDFAAALAENAALAAGYWPILAAEYERQRGVAERRAADRDFAALDRAAAGGNAAAFLRARDQVARALDGFTAAPFTPEEQARRANQLTRFLDLVPIEYDDGTEDGRVTIPFELQEAVAFTEGAESAFNDLEATLQERDPRGSPRWSARSPSSRATPVTPTAAAPSPRWRTWRPPTTAPAPRSTRCSPRNGRRAARTPTST